jgi:hypothetical protein
MKWTENKGQAGIDANGNIFQPVTYTSDDNPPQVITKIYTAAIIAADWPDSLVRAELDRLNSLDISVLATGAAAPAPPASDPVIDPTQQKMLAQQALAEALRASDLQAQAAASQDPAVQAAAAAFTTAVQAVAATAISANDLAGKSQIANP